MKSTKTKLSCFAQPDGVENSFEVVLLPQHGRKEPPWRTLSFVWYCNVINGASHHVRRVTPSCYTYETEVHNFRALEGNTLCFLVVRHLLLVANIVTTSKALVTTSVALVTSRHFCYYGNSVTSSKELPPCVHHRPSF